MEGHALIKALNRIGVTSLLAVIALATPVLAQEAVDGAFSITLPEGFGEFAKQTQKSSAPEGGEIETTNWVSKSPAGEAVVVTQSTMPGRILDPAKMIESTRDSLLKTLNAELESEEPIEGEAPSARLRFRSNGAVFRSRFVVDENRFYQILFVGRSDEGRNAPAVDELFRSFSIVTPPPADPAQVSSN
jgi:hypothetical protein